MTFHVVKSNLRFLVSPGKLRPWKLIDVIVSSKIVMESALGMLTILERRHKKLGLNVGKIMPLLSRVIQYMTGAVH